MARTSNARQLLVETAARLFQTRGFHGTGLSLILEESGAPKGSFYHHFPGGKDELAVAAMQWSSLEIEEFIDTAFKDAKSFSIGARALGKRLADWFESSRFSEGCPVASVLLETAPASEPLRKEALAVFDLWIEALEGHARNLGHPKPRQTAEGLMMGLEGAWLLARARHSRKPFDIAVSTALAA
ncbi:TetR/AcrR family transcriptional regulator [Pyruvatibacter sp.]|uniref:TetR/AcrR family transcriptional regulator n=1 Tax=Pyruvatibacter sp. TaxID=1981328 RepID=UPI003266C61E